VVYQSRLPVSADGPYLVSPMPGSIRAPTLGVAAYLTNPAQQSDAFKELVNKLAWAVGSTYRVQYGNTRSNTRQIAVTLAKLLITDQGYPGHIQKD